MNSDQILGIGNWYQCGEAVRNAPNSAGVYVFRLARAIQRLKGDSDVVYIGTTGKGERTIQTRLKEHLDVHEGGPMFARVANEVGPMEVAWISLPDHLR